jgi:hypothetical protein
MDPLKRPSAKSARQHTLRGRISQRTRFVEESSFGANMLVLPGRFGQNAIVLLLVLR